MIQINAKVLIAAAIQSEMTESEICRVSGVAHQTWDKMKQGKMVKFPSVQRICKTLDVKPAEILLNVDHEALPAQGQKEPIHPAQREVDQRGHG